MVNGWPKPNPVVLGPAVHLDHPRAEISHRRRLLDELIYPARKQETILTIFALDNRIGLAEALPPAHSSKYMQVAA